MSAKIPKEIRRALPRGFSIGYPVVAGRGSEAARKIGASSGSHPYVLLPDGSPLRSATGVPICISASPRSQRSVLNDLARIRRALRDQGLTCT